VSYDEKRKMTGAPYYQARKYLEQVVGDLVHNLVPLLDFDLEKDEWGKQLTAPYEPQRSAVIVKDGQIWGVVGEFKSSVRRAFKLPAYSTGFEINLGIVNTASVAYRQLPRYPKVEQDISLKVPVSTSFQTVYELLAAEVLGQPNTLAHLQPLDIYQRQDDAKHKQLSFRLTIASYEKTLKSEEVNTLLDKAADVAKEKLHAERI
jgi:phenylalanyl-tRNA synthetase beta subunit